MDLDMDTFQVTWRPMRSKSTVKSIFLQKCARSRNAAAAVVISKGTLKIALSSAPVTGSQKVHLVLDGFNNDHEDGQDDDNMHKVCTLANAKHLA